MRLGAVSRLHSSTTHQRRKVADMQAHRRLGVAHHSMFAATFRQLSRCACSNDSSNAVAASYVQPLLVQQTSTSSSNGVWHPSSYTPQRRVLAAVNDAVRFSTNLGNASCWELLLVHTKWVVTAVVSALFLWQHNEFAAWCVVGSILSSFLCKVMKHVINEARPEHAQKRDPGMPSSHANSLNFLSVYAAMSLKHHTSSQAWAVVLAAFTVAMGAFLTWLRVHLGFHTGPQVLVGAGLGAATAATWFQIGMQWAMPDIQRSAVSMRVLYATTLLAIAAFGSNNIQSWTDERIHRQHLKQQQRLQAQQLVAVEHQAEVEMQSQDPAQHEQQAPLVASVAVR